MEEPIKSNHITTTLPNSTSSALDRETAIGVNRCGELVFYLLHTNTPGAGRMSFYDPTGKAMGLSLNVEHGGTEVNVVNVPKTNNEWYIIYTVNSSSIYNFERMVYTRVKYDLASKTLTLIENEITIGGASDYIHAKAVSAHVNGDTDKHYLYLVARKSGVNSIRFHRFIIDEVGIHTKQESPNNIPATWWYMNVSGASLELTHDGNMLAFLNRTQTTTTEHEDIIIFDTREFANQNYTPLTLNIMNLLLTINWQGNTVVKSISELTNTAPYNSQFSCFNLISSKLWSIEFSPSGQYLYFSGGGVTGSLSNTFRSYLGQIDLKSGGQTPAKNVRLQIQEAYGTTGCEGGDYFSAGRNAKTMYKINSAYDGHLYFSKTNGNKLYIIPYPDCEMPQNLTPSDVDLSTPSTPNIELPSNRISHFIPEGIDGYNYVRGGAFDVIFQLSQNMITEGNSIMLSTTFQLDKYDYFVEWGDGTSEQITENITHSYPTKGDYKIKLIVTEIGGCSNSAEKNLLVYECLDPLAVIETNLIDGLHEGINSICLSDKIVFQNKSINGVFFQWILGDGTTLNRNDMHDILHEYKNSGIYEVWLKAHNPQGCGKIVDSTSVVITVNQSTATAQDDDDICEGSAYTLKAFGGMDHEWSSNDGFRSTLTNPIVSPTDTTLYFVSITDTNGCTKTDSV